VVVRVKRKKPDRFFDRPGSLTTWADGSRTTGLAPDLRDVLGRGALGALDDVELNALAFSEGAETAALDRRVVNEAVLLTALWGDETKALRVVEPLYSAGGTHFRKLLVLLCRRSSGTCRTHRPTVARDVTLTTGALRRSRGIIGDFPD